MSLSINLFQQAFGITPGGIYAPKMESGKANFNAGLYSGLKFLESVEEVTEMSHLGTPIVHPITFLAGKYTIPGYDISANGQPEKRKKIMGDFRLPSTSIISLSREKKMRTTQIEGSYHSVKEIYGFDDYQITINGFLIPDPSHPQGYKTPKQQEKELVRWDGIADRVSVTSDILSIHGITDLSITKIDFGVLRGRPNVVPFTINALSDEAVELNINAAVGI